MAVADTRILRLDPDLPISLREGGHGRPALVLHGGGGPATVPAEQAALRRANLATMRIMAGPSMHDPDLLGRLGRIDVPTLVIWGDSDRIVTPEYGRAMGAAFANARFAIITDAGHLPHLE